MNTNKAKLTQAVVRAASSVIGAGMYDSTPPAVSYDDNSNRSKGSREFKHKKSRRKIADKAKRANRGR